MGTSRLRTPSGARLMSRDPEGVPAAAMATPKKFGRPKKVSRGRHDFFAPRIAMVTRRWRRTRARDAEKREPKLLAEEHISADGVMSYPLRRHG
jgi:hypothetical protein